MGIIPNIFNDIQPPVVEQLSVEKPEKPKETKYLTRVTIEWEDKTRKNTVFEGVDFNYSSGYIVFDLKTNQNGVKTNSLVIPKENIHCINVEATEVPGE